MTVGSGFRYLMESVAAGDLGARPSDGLTAYYAASGTPPGRFLGAGLAGLAEGRGVERGSEVTEEHLSRMLKDLADPVTGERVGRTPAASPSRAPVAGFDLTFSPSKSVSVAWALADAATKAVIYECHRQAIDTVLAYAEEHVFKSRSGAGGVVEEDVAGVVATAFTHWDSRSGDPQLHDHVVVWNRAKSVGDGRWRTLDGRILFKATVMLSELHQGVLSDLLTDRLGVGWEGRSRRHSSHARYEITGVPEVLMEEFSQRSAQVEDRSRVLRDGFVHAHGRQPSTVEMLRLRQQATIETRPAKAHRSLQDMTSGWRDRARSVVGDPASQQAWVASLAGRNDLPLLHAKDLAGGMLDDAGTSVREAVAARRATFGRHNVMAEALRVLHGVRFASPAERIVTAERITELALGGAVCLTPPELHPVPKAFRRADGTSKFRSPSRDLFTTPSIFEAEDRLLAASHSTGGPTVTAGAWSGPRPTAGRAVSGEQVRAVDQIVTSGRRLDVLVGAAGTGKSTTMATVREVWEAAHGEGSVLGLAPSAAAAEVLGDELGVVTENVAKWLHEYRRLPELAGLRSRMRGQLTALGSTPRQRHALEQVEGMIRSRCLQKGQLVIVDEASLAGTFALDELTSAAGRAGAKVLLVGDWAQLTSVEAGGAFGMLARDRGDDAPRLGEVRRFHEEWEKQASARLRVGDPNAVDTYVDHGRVSEGDRDGQLDALYAAWALDRSAGLSSLMVAQDRATVAELNQRARADLVTAGAVAETGVSLSDGSQCGPGDRVVTRRNDRHLHTGTGWVRNGDRWDVTRVESDGSLVVTRPDSTVELTLPHDYVAEHVELGYAATTHQAQGRTVDTAHAFISPTDSRETLYVAATRGRLSNRLYVDTCYDPDPQTSHPTDPSATGRDVLADIASTPAGEVSAHEALANAYHDAAGAEQLAAQYETIAQSEHSKYWGDSLLSAGLTPLQVNVIQSSETFGPLVRALRRGEDEGLPIRVWLPKHLHGLDRANDPAAALHHRVNQYRAAHGQTDTDHSRGVGSIVGRPGPLETPLWQVPAENVDL